jgi:hypothetical protein
MPPPALGIARLLVPKQQVSPCVARKFSESRATPQTQPTTLPVHPAGIFQVHSINAGVVNHPDMSSDQTGDIGVEVHGSSGNEKSRKLKCRGGNFNRKEAHKFAKMFTCRGFSFSRFSFAFLRLNS